MLACYLRAKGDLAGIWVRDSRDGSKTMIPLDLATIVGCQNCEAAAVCPQRMAAAAPAPEPATDDEGPAEGLRDIYAVYVAAGVGVKIKPDEVARRLKCDDSQHFRRKFTRLSKAGFITSTHHDGYFLPEN